MQLVLDENIPFAEAFFSAVTTEPLVTVPGRDLSGTVDDVILRSARALIIRSVTQVDEALLEKCPNLSFVGTCTIGTDHIDVNACKRRGIRVASAPGCNANAVVEYVFSALAALEVDWQQLTVGIVGCGNVGGALLRCLYNLGVSCKVYDPLLQLENLEEEFKAVVETVRVHTLADVLTCDMLSLHTPLTETGPFPTRHLFGFDELNQLKPNALLLNAGRGPVIDNDALQRVLNQRKDLRVILDVWETEPNVPVELMGHVAIASPHIAGYSFDGKAIGTEMIYAALCDHFQLPKTVSLKELLPVYSGPASPAPDSELTSVALINYVILQAYNVRNDDSLMRLTLNPLQLGGEVASAFDRLRKDYPVRREFPHYVFSKELLDVIQQEGIGPVLQRLGFTL